VGNVPLEMLLLNLRMLGELERPEPAELTQYVRVAANAIGWTVPHDHPLFARSAFEPAVERGVHARATGMPR
jgi:hypothetical protein